MTHEMFAFTGFIHGGYGIKYALFFFSFVFLGVFIGEPTNKSNGTGTNISTTFTCHEHNLPDSA
jgi:hypothetical protein